MGAPQVVGRAGGCDHTVLNQNAAAGVVAGRFDAVVKRISCEGKGLADQERFLGHLALGVCCPM